MAYQGEYFVERYGYGAAETPPVAKILGKGVKTSAGTDATRVASTIRGLARLARDGRTVGGMQITPIAIVSIGDGVRMWTENVTWFSNEEGKKGRSKVGQLADLIVPDRDYFSVRGRDRGHHSHLTIVAARSCTQRATSSSSIGRCRRPCRLVAGRSYGGTQPGGSARERIDATPVRAKLRLYAQLRHHGQLTARAWFEPSAGR